MRAIAVRGGSVDVIVGTLTLQYSTVSGNTGGRGVLNVGGRLTIAASAISGNGTGVVHSNNFSVITNSTISGNTAGGVDAGFGGVTITNSTISDNTGRGVRTFARTIIETSTISGNTGGGVFNGDETSMSILNSTISGNSGVGFGGGIDNDGILTLSNSTVSRNSAANRGAGVYNTGRLTLARTLLSGNTAPEGPEMFHDPYGRVTADNYNLFGHDGDAGVVGFTPGATDLVPAEPLDAILDPALADNGGPTRTHALVPGSPAIDASPADTACAATDQRGVPRPQDGDEDTVALCDIGAFERAAVTYDFGGFLPPVDGPPTFNTRHAGSAVPVKFSLGGDQGLDILMAGYPASRQINCDTADARSAIELTDGGSLSYDAAADTYSFAWKTDREWAGTCRLLSVRLNDGSEHTAYFDFR